MAFDTSQSIEPLFSLVGPNGNVNEVFERTLEATLPSQTERERMLEHVRDAGSCQGLDLPAEIKRRFRTAVEIGYDEHFEVLIGAQKFSDEAVSKTINLPNDATPEDVRDVYCRAYDEGLNGMTIYRSGTAEDQPKKLGE